MIFDADNNFYNVMVYFDAFVYGIRINALLAIDTTTLLDMLRTYQPLSTVGDQSGCTDG